MKKKKRNNRSGNSRKKKHKKQKHKKQMKKMLSILWSCLFYFVTISIFISSVLFAVTQIKGQNVLGYQAFGVLSNSMVSPDNTVKSGGFRAGDIIILKEISPKEIKVGDIVTYHTSTNSMNQGTNYLTHRVVEVSNHLEEGFITTKGDANTTNDMPVSVNQLVGKVVFRIPKIGGLLAFIKENSLLSLVFILSVLGFVWVLRVYIVGNNVISPPKKIRVKKQNRLKHGITSKQEGNINNLNNRRKYK